MLIYGPDAARPIELGEIKSEAFGSDVLAVESDAVGQR